MKIAIDTKFDIGDTVYALLNKWEMDPYFKPDFSKLYDIMQLYKMKVSAIRYVKDNDYEGIEYFLEGLHSFEGENWFREPDDNDDKYRNNYFYEQRLFANEKIAKESYEFYIQKEKEQMEKENKETK